MTRYYDLDTWLKVMGVETAEDYQNLYRIVSKKKKAYLYCLLGLMGLSLVAGFSRNSTVTGFSFILMFLDSCLYPFFYKTYSLCKALEVRDLNAKTSILLFFVYVLCFVMIVPLIIALIIRATNWGMGLNNWENGRR